MDRSSLDNSSTISRLQQRRNEIAVAVFSTYEHYDSAISSGIVRHLENCLHALDVSNALYTNKSILDYLIDNLKHNDGVIREKAARALAWMGAKAADAVPHLFQSISDSDSRTRERAIIALREICKDNPEALSVLIQALQNENVLILLGVMVALYGIGEKAITAVPWIIQLNKKFDGIDVYDGIGDFGKIFQIVSKRTLDSINDSKGSTYDLNRYKINASKTVSEPKKLTKRDIDMVSSLVGRLKAEDRYSAVEKLNILTNEGIRIFLRAAGPSAQKHDAIAVANLGLGIRPSPLSAPKSAKPLSPRLQKIALEMSNEELERIQEIQRYPEKEIITLNWQLLDVRPKYKGFPT